MLTPHPPNKLRVKINKYARDFVWHTHIITCIDSIHYTFTRAHKYHIVAVNELSTRRLDRPVLKDVSSSSSLATHKKTDIQIPHNIKFH